MNTGFSNTSCWLKQTFKVEASRLSFFCINIDVFISNCREKGEWGRLPSWPYVPPWDERGRRKENDGEIERGVGSPS